MLVPIVDRLKLLEEGMLMFDAFRGKMVYVQLCLMAWLGDNPMLEKISMITSKDTCRMCDGTTRATSVSRPRKQTATMNTFRTVTPAQLRNFGMGDKYSSAFDLTTLDAHR